MSGILTVRERNKAISRLRNVAEKIIHDPKNADIEELRAAWCGLPELRYDPLPSAGEIVRMLDEMDRRNPKHAACK